MTIVVLGSLLGEFMDFGVFARRTVRFNVGDFTPPVFMQLDEDPERVTRIDSLPAEYCVYCRYLLITAVDPTGDSEDVGGIVSLTIIVASTTEDSITLQFAAVNDGVGNPANTALRRSAANQPLVWDTAAATEILDTGATAIGEIRELTFTGLSAGNFYVIRGEAYTGTRGVDDQVVASGNTVEGRTLGLVGNAPNAASSLVATPTGTSSIDLGWTRNSTDEDGTRIQQQLPVGSWITIATVGIGITGYTVTGLQAATDYCFRVIKFNTSGDAPVSNTACETTFGTVPVGGGGVDAGPNQSISLGATDTITFAGEAPGPYAYWYLRSGPQSVIFGNNIKLETDFVETFEHNDLTRNWREPNSGCCNFITTAVKLRGSRSWAAQNGTGPLSDKEQYNAKLLTTDNPTNDRIKAEGGGYFFGWIFWPVGYNIKNVNGKGYVNLYQWKQYSTQAEKTPTFLLCATYGQSSSVDAEWGIHDKRGGKIIRTGVPITKGGWRHVMIYNVWHFTAGKFFVWIDGSLIIHLEGINTLGDPNTNLVGRNMWGVGNYGKSGLGKVLYWDEIGVQKRGFASMLGTTAKFTDPGAYIFRLVSTNGSWVTTQDEMTVTVTA